SANLGLLYQCGDPRERIEIMTTIYYALGRTLHYLALSEWWWLLEFDQLDTAASAPPPAFSLSDPDNFPAIDHWARFLALEDYLAALPAARQLPRFFPQFRELVAELRKPDADASAALAWFGNLRNVADIDRKTAEPDASAETEYLLAVLLRATAFLVEYQVYAVRDIGVSHRRGRPADFNHTLGELYAQNGDHLAVDGKFSQKGHPYHTNAVVMTRRDQVEITPFLCLSPLIIDLNSHYSPQEHRKNSLLRVFIFSYTKGDRYYWHEADLCPFAGTHEPGQVIHSAMTEREFNVGDQERAPERRRPRQGSNRLVLREVGDMIAELRKDLAHDA
ncbi:MAG: hypothetical protein AAFZ52_15470, partial [Bacteroidota bacterium]